MKQSVYVALVKYLSGLLTPEQWEDFIQWAILRAIGAMPADKRPEIIKLALEIINNAEELLQEAEAGIIKAG